MKQKENRTTSEEYLEEFYALQKRRKAQAQAYYRDHRDARLAYQKEYRETHPRKDYAKECPDTKEVVLTHYGNGKLACVRCGEVRLSCLTISGNNKRRGQGLYAWLKRHEYPEDYQTLCMNCQFVKKSVESSQKQDKRY